MSIDAPDYVYAGQAFSAHAEVQAKLPGATIVKALPLAIAGACTLTSYSVTGGIPLGGGYYVLTSAVALAPLLDTTGDPVELADTLDFSLSLDTSESTLGGCKPGISAIELASQLAGGIPTNISKLVSVVALPATPIALGAVTTYGGNDVEDHAEVTVAATPSKLPIVVFTSNPKVALKGTISHVEYGPTWEDDGYFEIRQAGIALNHDTLSQSGDAKVLEAESALPHAKGQTVETNYCLYGVYVDGGLWTDDEGPAETCMTVAATEPADPSAEPILLAEACAVFGLATTQLHLMHAAEALEKALPHDLPGGAGGLLPSGSPPSLDQVYFLFDKEFGHFCPT